MRQSQRFPLLVASTAKLEFGYRIGRHFDVVIPPALNRDCCPVDCDQLADNGLS
jgi:hypothetical protein